MMPPSSDTDAQRPSGRRWLWPLAKWTLFLIVVAFISQRAWQLWHQQELGQMHLDVTWLVLAGTVYATGWLPSVWFWRRLIGSLGGTVSLRDAARAYYCGHLGKYVPGKALVLVIRAGMLRPLGIRLTAGAVTATYETIVLMAVALAVAAALSPWFLTTGQWQQVPVRWAWLHARPAVIPCLVLALVVVLLPITSRLLSLLARKATPRDFSETDSDRATPLLISTSLLYQGCLAFVVAWMCHGLSLGLTLRALAPDAFQLVHWPVWTASVSLATSVGFIAVFAPGGLGVREGLLIETLRSVATGPQAILAAVLLRAVWFATEILVAAVLYYAAWPKGPADTLKETNA